METTEKSLRLKGNKPHQVKARKALPILVRQAKAGQRIYYADLANEIGIPNPRNLNYPLGSIGTALKDLSEQWGKEIPQIQCIVVNQATELPGEGIDSFISDTEQFAKFVLVQRESDKCPIDLSY